MTEEEVILKDIQREVKQATKKYSKAQKIWHSKKFWRRHWNPFDVLSYLQGRNNS